MFLGDGNFASSSRDPVQGAIREVVGGYQSLPTWLELMTDVIDDRQLNFDTPDPRAAVKRGMPGAKAHKDRR